MTIDQLKSYHSDRTDALCPGHPEIEHEGIEVTTGPLGQGVSNAVGLAMATKHLAATYNKPGFDLINNHTWCMVGDACLQEGVALEAISLAGHLKIDNLTIIYDNNQVTCDGSVDLTNSEQINEKMRATGWDVVDIEDGCFDIDAIVAALTKARTASGKPTFINVHTVIGVGSAVAGDALAHGAALGKEDVANMKRLNGLDPEKSFQIRQETIDFFGDLPAKGEKLVHDWNDLLAQYVSKFNKSGVELQMRMAGNIKPDWKSLIPQDFPTTVTPSRKSSGLVFNPIAQDVNSFMVGTADLSPSVHMIWKDKVDFQNVSFQMDLNYSTYRNHSLTGPYSLLSELHVELMYIRWPIYPLRN